MPILGWGFPGRWINKEQVSDRAREISTPQTSLMMPIYVTILVGDFPLAGGSPRSKSQGGGLYTSAWSLMRGKTEWILGRKLLPCLTIVGG